MGCFWYSRLSKNFRLSIASSVDSNQSNPSVSLRSFWVSITFLKVGSFFIARIHCRFSKSTFLSSFLYTGRRAFSAFTRATFSESLSPSYSLINALSWVSGTFSAECDLVDACQWDNAKFIVDFRGHNGHQGHKGQNFNVVFFSGTRHTLATPSHVEVARGKRTRASSQRITRNAFFRKCFIYESHTLQFLHSIKLQHKLKYLEA